jgi:ribonuclease-3
VESRGYELLEGKLGYTFKDRSLLEAALTHKSYVNENPHPRRTHNQRLEFLGDAVLGLAVGHMLMARLPDTQEGELSMMRADIVSEASVAGVAGTIALGEWLFLGRGEENTGGRRKPSILADACEAVLGAIFLDGGYGGSRASPSRPASPTSRPASRSGPRRSAARCRSTRSRPRSGPITPSTSR